MNSATVETATKKVVRAMTAATDTTPADKVVVGIREIALAVEEVLDGVSLDEIHAAVRKVARMFQASAVPTLDAERQHGFAYRTGKSEAEWLVWVCR
jgi:hypothetical protein